MLVGKSLQSMNSFLKKLYIEKKSTLPPFRYLPLINLWLRWNAKTFRASVYAHLIFYSRGFVWGQLEIEYYNFYDKNPSTR